VNSGARADPFVSPHVEFDALAMDAQARHAAYRALFQTEIDESVLEAIRDATNGDYPLASESFKDTVIAPLGWRTGPGKPGPRPNPRIATLTPN
jgi:putative transposase